jgi:hypothetical protein
MGSERHCIMDNGMLLVFFCSVLAKIKFLKNSRAKNRRMTQLELITNHCLQSDTSQSSI